MSGWGVRVNFSTNPQLGDYGYRSGGGAAGSSFSGKIGTRILFDQFNRETVSQIQKAAGEFVLGLGARKNRSEETSFLK